MPFLHAAELTHIYNTYGPNALLRLSSIANSDAFQGATGEEVVDAFIRQPTPTTSYFFRDSSLRAIAEHIAPRLNNPNGALEVRHVGGGPGYEAYSFGALLAGNGVSFESVSLDANPDVAPTEKRPTFTYHWDPADYFLVEADADRYVRPYFDVTRVEKEEKDDTKPVVHYLVTPKEVLTDHTTFGEHDLLERPAPGTPDITLARNIFWHYPWETRDTLLLHALGGMTRGIVALEACDNHTRIPDYSLWVASLGKFGLTPCIKLRGTSSAQIRRRVFDYNAEANTAL